MDAIEAMPNGSHKQPPPLQDQSYHSPNSFCSQQLPPPGQQVHCLEQARMHRWADQLEPQQPRTIPPVAPAWIPSCRRSWSWNETNQHNSTFSQFHQEPRPAQSWAHPQSVLHPNPPSRSVTPTTSRWCSDYQMASPSCSRSWRWSEMNQHNPALSQHHQESRPAQYQAHTRMYSTPTILRGLCHSRSLVLGHRLPLALGPFASLLSSLQAWDNHPRVDQNMVTFRKEGSSLNPSLSELQDAPKEKLRWEPGRFKTNRLESAINARWGKKNAMARHLVTGAPRGLNVTAVRFAAVVSF
ncbi:hypothetical protein GE09DRAFT_789526 [Coniochaeta sp. 2T2.1]|nr:hypothetical protein GE09DRAFT_789526 [Coniochaeta sp. 2T2.1]